MEDKKDIVSQYINEIYSIEYIAKRKV